MYTSRFSAPLLRSWIAIGEALGASKMIPDELARLGIKKFGRNSDQGNLPTRPTRRINSFRWPQRFAALAFAFGWRSGSPLRLQIIQNGGFSR